jgi:hypothetical protein
VSWDTSIVWAMPLWLCAVLLIASGSTAAWLMWTDHRRDRDAQ